MARVVKLPSGLIFRDRESIGRRVTAKGTPAGMKGQFGAKAIGQFIDLADKVVSSKAIGAVSSAIEGGLEDTPEEAKAKLKKEAAEKRAKTRKGHQEAAKVAQEPRTQSLPKPKVGPVTAAVETEEAILRRQMAEVRKRREALEDAKKAEELAREAEEKAKKAEALATATPATVVATQKMDPIPTAASRSRPTAASSRRCEKSPGCRTSNRHQRYRKPASRGW
jgi:hypothetical protein